MCPPIENERPTGDRQSDLPRLLDALYHFASAPEEPDSLFVLSGLMTELMDDLVGTEDHPPAFLASHIDRAVSIAEKVGDTAPEDSGTIVPNVIVLGREMLVKDAGEEALPAIRPFVQAVRVGMRLCFRDADLQQQLADSVRQVDQGALGFDVLQLGGGNQPCHCFVQKDKDGIILSVLPLTESHIIHESVATKHGITGAELRLLNIVQTGTGLKAAAAELGISHNTARNQLSSIFAKLGVRRQAELVRHLTLLNLFATLEHQANRLPDTRTGTDKLAGQAIEAYRAPDVTVLEDGRRLAYSVLGPRAGRPVLYFSSPLQAPILSDEMLANLTAHNVCLIAVHRPGFGGSTRNEAMDWASFGQDIGQLAQTVCKTFGCARVPALAVSSAASFALAAAATPHTQISAVGLVAPRIKIRGQNSAASPGGSPLFVQALKARSWAVQFGYAVMKTRISDRWIDTMIDRVYADSPRDLAYLRANSAVREMIIKSGRLCFEADAATLTREVDLLRDGLTMPLSDIDQPVIAWHGADDLINPPDQTREILAGLSRLDYRLLPDEGHLILEHYLTDIVDSLLDAVTDETALSSTAV